MQANKSGCGDDMLLCEATISTIDPSFTMVGRYQKKSPFSVSHIGFGQKFSASAAVK